MAQRARLKSGLESGKGYLMGGKPTSLPPRLAVGSIALILVCLTNCLVLAETFALVVGISKYSSREIPNLRYASADATAVRNVLVERCGVPPRNVYSLVDSAATKQAIISALSSLTMKAKPSDTVIIYFSGHGSFIVDTDGDEEDGLDEVLLPHDAVPGREDSFIVDDELGWWVSRFLAGGVVVILDTCHSGGQGKSANPMNLSARGPGDSVVRDLFTGPMVRPGRILLAASGAGQRAYEDSRLGHGIFTYFLLLGLRDRFADANRDGQITATELGEYVVAEVERWAAEHRYIQNPLFENPSGQRIVLVSGTTTANPPTETDAGTRQSGLGFRLTILIPCVMYYFCRPDVPDTGFEVFVGTMALWGGDGLILGACDLFRLGRQLFAGTLAVLHYPHHPYLFRAILGLELRFSLGNTVGIGLGLGYYFQPDGPYYGFNPMLSLAWVF